MPLPSAGLPACLGKRAASPRLHPALRPAASARPRFASSSSPPKDAAPPAAAAGKPPERYSMYGLEAGFNEVRRDRTYVDSLHKGGFTINKRRHAGPVLLLRNLALSWKVPADMSALSQDCFDVFAFVEPVPSLIILGTGNTLRYLNADVLKALRSLAPVEVLDSRNAVATFNILTQEDRIVGAALLPLT